MQWGTKPMFLGYGLYWKGDFCSSLQSELPQDREGRVRWHPSSLVSWHGKSWSAKPSPREAGLPSDLPPPLSLVRGGIPPGSRRAENMQSPFTLPWICGEKSGHVSSPRGLVQEERMQPEQTSPFWELMWQSLPAFNIFFSSSLFKECWEISQPFPVIFILDSATKICLIPWGENLPEIPLRLLGDCAPLGLKRTSFMSLWRECKK